MGPVPQEVPTLSRQVSHGYGGHGDPQQLRSFYLGDSRVTQEEELRLILRTSGGVPIAEGILESELFDGTRGSKCPESTPSTGGIWTWP